MRKVTCKGTMAKHLDSFLDTLGTKLLQDIGREKLLDEEPLCSSLLSVISSLPSSDIKDELTDNFKESFEKLKRFISSSKIVQESDWSFNIVNDDGLLGALMNIEKNKSFEEKRIMYSELISCCIVACTDKVTRIFEHWAKHIEQAPPADILNTICSVSKFIPWLFDLKPLLIFLSQSLLILLPNNDDSLLDATRNILFRIITVTYNRDDYYRDKLSQFIVVYVKLCVKLMKEIPVSFISTILVNIAGHSPDLVLNILLQLDIDNNPILYSPLLSVVIQHVLSCYFSSIQLNPSLYIQVYYCIMLLSETPHFARVKNQFESFMPPKNLSQWVWSQSSSYAHINESNQLTDGFAKMVDDSRENILTCELLTLKREWTSQRLKKFLVQTICKEQFHLLFNFVMDETSITPIQCKPVSTVDNSDIFYVDSQGHKEGKPLELSFPKSDSKECDNVEDTDNGLTDDTDNLCYLTPFVTRNKPVSNKKDKVEFTNTRKRRSTSKVPAQSEQKKKKHSSTKVSTPAERRVSQRLLRSTAKKSGIVI